MANVINHAEKWQRELIQTFIDNSYIAPFVTTNVNWLDAKTFHFTTMQVEGYGNHNLAGGWNRKSIKQTDHPYTLTMDRDVEFMVDKLEVDESNQTASIQKVSNTFEKTQATPEMDSYFFSKVATIATANNLKTSTARSEYTVENIFSKIKQFIAKLKTYKNEGLVVYIDTDLMDLLDMSKELSKSIDVTTISANGGKAIQTRIVTIDGTPLIEVLNNERFYSKYDFSDGAKPAVGAYKINLLGATAKTTVMVPKISSIYYFAPGQHTEGDGYLYQNRAHYDTFVFPNGKDGKIDSVYVDLDTTAVEE